MEKTCPICSETLTTTSKGDIEVDVCTHGVWLDKQELFKLTEHDRHEKGPFQWADLFRREQNPVDNRTGPLRCPIDGNEMVVEDYNGVSIDWCSEHGVWLDSGEYEAIVNNLRLDSHYVRGMALRLSDLKY